MKRMCWILIATAMVISTTGCQSMCRRGARCRPSLSLPTFGMHGNKGGGGAPMGPGPGPGPAVQGCNSGCNTPGGMQSSGYAPQPYMVGEPVQSNEVIVNEYTTGPVEGPVGAPVQVNRPYIASPATDSPKSGNFVDVPGPEAGPLPNN